jgi:FkbM family methyltransferase
MTKIVEKRKSPRGLSYILDSLAFERINNSSSRIIQKRGYRVAAFANDLIGNWISVFGVWEHEELDQVFKFLKPLSPKFLTSTALDVGANIGNHTMCFAQFFDKVVAFEPNRKTYELLRLNSQAFSNIAPLNYGLGESKGISIMSEDLLNSGGAMISSETTQGVPITIEALDSLDFGNVDISLIKLDVEGFEEKVLKGGLHLIQRHAPVILLEQHESDFIDGKSAALELLRQNDYQFFWLKSGSLNPVSYLAAIENALEVFFGRTHRIFSSIDVPVGNYPMIIASPTKYSPLLLGQTSA